MQLHISRSAFRLSREFDGQRRPKSSKSAAAAILAGAMALSGCKDDQSILKSEFPSILAEGPHWFALYKPPFWISG